MPGKFMIFGSAIQYDPYWGLTRLVVEPEDLRKIDVLVLWGGEDISPSIYGQKTVRAIAQDKPSERDQREMELTTEAVRLGVPILGICRGAQLLCAMHGGELWQHVDGHVGQHQIVVESWNNTVGYTNSCHHQMMKPDKEATVLASTPKPLSLRKWGESTSPEYATDPEPEIVWFPKFRALGVQGHPEWLPKNSFLNRVTEFLLKEKLNETRG